MMNVAENWLKSFWEGNFKPPFFYVNEKKIPTKNGALRTQKELIERIDILHFKTSLTKVDICWELCGSEFILYDDSKSDIEYSLGLRYL